MKTRELAAAALGAALLLGMAVSTAAWNWTAPTQIPPQADLPNSMLQAQTAVLHWPEDSRQLAQSLLEQYGAPDEVMPHFVTWLARGPFTTVTVYDDRVSSGRDGILMQSVPYRVPVTKWRDLSNFGHGVIYDVVFNELVAYSDGPETNLLSLNLADQVLQGERTVDQARGDYDKILRRSLAGRSSPMMKSLRFDPKTRKAD